jgi:2-oxoisovalerate dehydrogenase E2 component (dihydrolipoyl transacylase)
VTVPLEFVLPDVGEGIDAGEIIAWYVAVGDRVTEDQPLVDVQTDKALVTIPCPATGVVLERHGEPGDTIAVGTTLAVFEPTADGSGPAGRGFASAGRRCRRPRLAGAAAGVAGGAQARA